MGGFNSKDENDLERPDNVGILAIELYCPQLFVDQSSLEKFDGVSEGKYTVGLGQTRMAFCSDREDSTSMCLTVADSLMANYHINPEDIGYVIVGSETLTDRSKSIKSSLMRLFQNPNLGGSQTLGACYAGTDALFQAVTWVDSRWWNGKYALVVMTDIAVYEKGPARPTGGAGAVALLIGPNAPLVIDDHPWVFHSEDTWDFYKPHMDSEYAEVNGTLSINTYFGALQSCYKEFSSTNDTSLKNFDAIIFHAPYSRLVQKSFSRLWISDCIAGLDHQSQEKYRESLSNIKLDEQLTKDVEKKILEISKDAFSEKTEPSLRFGKELGNIYTGSLYACLASYLRGLNSYNEQPRNDLHDRRVLLFSYGSGCSAAMFGMRVNLEDDEDSQALSQIFHSIDRFENRLAARIQASPSEFSETLKLREDLIKSGSPYNPKGSPNETSVPGTYYLTEIDSKGKRYYEKIVTQES